MHPALRGAELLLLENARTVASEADSLANENDIDSIVLQDVCDAIETFQQSLQHWQEMLALHAATGAPGTTVYVNPGEKAPSGAIEINEPEFRKP